jgi:hypothetical protein
MRERRGWKEFFYFSSLRNWFKLISCSSIFACIKDSARWKSSSLSRSRLFSIRKWRFSSFVCDHLRLYSRKNICAFSTRDLSDRNCTRKSSCWPRKRVKTFVECSKRSSSVWSRSTSSLKSTICSSRCVVILAHRSLVSDAWLNRNNSKD